MGPAQHEAVAMTKRFRARPIEIDAAQFVLGKKPYPEGVVAVMISRENPDVCLGPYTKDTDPEEHKANVGFGIRTLEGYHVVTHEDWIVTGTRGERYPVKEEIFKEKYEAV